MCTTIYIVKPPRLSRGHWLLGDYPPLSNDALAFLNMLQKNSDQSIVHINLPLSGIALPHYFAVLSPHAARTILYDTTNTFIKGNATHHVRDYLFAPEGIIFMENSQRWNSLHKLFFTGPFNPREFPNRYSTIFMQNFEWLLQRWQTIEQPFDLYKEITFYTMRTIAQALFAYELNNKQIAEIIPAFKYILEFVQKRETSPIKLPLWFPLKTHRNFKQALKTFKAIVHDIVQYAPDTITINTIVYPTIIGQLKTFRDPKTNQPMNENEIVSHTATLFFAGHDTTANFLTMMLYQLIKNPKWYRTIKKEITEKLDGRSKAWFPMELLIEYTKFKNEILRLYPSVPIFSRDTTCNVIIDGIVIPKNSTLLIAVATINQHDNYYKNPTSFNPDRIEPENRDYQDNSLESFLPFSLGPRRCLGQWFAQAEARSFIAQLLSSNIHLELATNDKITMRMACTGLPSKPIYCRTCKN